MKSRAVLLLPLLALPLLTSASSLTNAQIQALEGLLTAFNVPQATIITVDHILRGIPTAAVGGTTGGGAGYTFTKPLTEGDKGTDVSELQTLLKAQGYFTYPSITGYFGPATAAAVAAFQKDHHLDAIGSIGPLTRAILNQLEDETTIPTDSTTPSTTITTTATSTCNAASSTTCVPGTSITQPVSPGNGYTPGYGGGGGGGGGGASASPSAPVISNISSGTPTATTATITWTTDQLSNSKVVWGATTSYGSASSGASLVTSHSVPLTGLTAATVYHYAVVSADGSGNTATSSDQTFTTASSVYVGFLDTYSAEGATWGFSPYKLTNAYTGKWGSVVRQSDGATTTIGFLSNGTVDVASFDSFCANTNCYVTTINDQVNGINATQATLSKMPRVIVDTNNVLSLCPQPGSSMFTAYNNAVNTPKVHLFAVAQLNYADSRWSQSTTPALVVTGNVTQGSASITNLSSVFGISTANNGGVGQVPGVTDSAGYLPSVTYLSGIAGSTASITFAPGNQSPTNSMVGDTLTFHNAVLPGAWITNGPASSAYDSTAYWGMGNGAANDQAPGDFVAPRNGTIGYQSEFQSVIGQGMRGQWGVYDYDTNTTQLNYDGVSLGSITGTTGNITYSTNTGMSLFADESGAESPSNSCFETMVLFPNTETSRSAMAQNLMSKDNISFPFATTTTDSFAMSGSYQPSYTPSPNNAFGSYSVGPDVFGLTWNPQSGGYTWPSIAHATNIGNTATMWRFIVSQGDSDTNITNAERSEIAESTVYATPGNSFSFFYQFNFESLPNEQGDWCFTGQIHYKNATAGANSPDIVALSCKGNQGQFFTQRTVGGNPVSTSCGAPFTITPGVTYAVVGTGFWSANQTSDTLTINAGPNGSPLPQICNLGPTTLWDNDTGAYLKAGVYRGYPWSNAGTVIERVMSPQMTATANAFSSYITSQPALPAVSGPTISLNTPAGGSTVNGSAVTVSATASDNIGTITQVQFKVDNSTIATDSSSPYSITWNSTGVSDGSHTLYAIAEDNGGLYATSTESITVQNTPPVISGIGTSSLATSSATIVWTTNDSSNSKVVYGTTASYGTASSSASLVTSHSISLTGLAGSTTYHYAVVSADSVGNTSTSSDQTFTTLTPDTTPPSAPTSLTATATSSSEIDLAWTASTDNVAVAYYAIYRAGIKIATTSQVSYNDTGLSASTTYSYYVTAIDTSNNESASSTLASTATLALSSGCTQSSQFLARVSVNTAHQTAYKTLICGLAQDGVWSKLDTLYVFATQNSSAAILNLVSTSYTVTSTTTLPIFTADTGFQGNGNGTGSGSAYLDTNFNPSTASGANLAANSASIFAWSTEASADYPSVIGGISDFFNLTLAPYDFGGNISGSINGSNLSVSAPGATGVGLSVGSRTSTSQIALYRNGSVATSTSSASAGSLSNSDIGIMLVDGYYYAGNVASAGFGAGLTSTDDSNLYSRLHTFLNTVNPTTFP